jgi:hypothetical protein
MPHLGLSPVEEAFFRAGDALSEAGCHDFADLDEGIPQRTIWQSILSWWRSESPVAIGRTVNSQF